MLEFSTKKFSGRSREFSRQPSRPSTPYTQYSPPAGILGVAPVDKATTEKHHPPPTRQKWTNKYEELRATRRANGLCMKCGEQYSPQHKCPPQVGLHLVEELMELLQQQEGDAEKPNDTISEDSDAEVLTLSCDAVTGTQVRRPFAFKVYYRTRRFWYWLTLGAQVHSSAKPWWNLSNYQQCPFLN